MNYFVIAIFVQWRDLSPPTGQLRMLWPEEVPPHTEINGTHANIVYPSQDGLSVLLISRTSLPAYYCRSGKKAPYCLNKFVPVLNMAATALAH